MPYNGSGTFNSLGVPNFPAVTGDVILASEFNANLNDIFLGLSTALPRDGQAAMAAPLAMANFKITGLGTGVNPADAVTFAQVFTTPTFTNATLAGVVTFSGATAAGTLQDLALTGTPTAPTATLGASTTQITNMAALSAALAALPSGALPSVVGKDSTWSLTPDDTGTTVLWTQISPTGNDLYLNTNCGGF